MIRGLSPLARAVLVLAGVLILAIAGQHRNLAREVQDLGVEPTGYRELVNRAFRDKLVYERVQDLDASDETGRLIIETRPERLTPADRQFLASSFLLDDLEHPERFEPRDDGTARLLPGFRRRPLPFSESAVWRGRITFAETTESPVLVSRSGRVLQLAGAATELPAAIPVPIPRALSPPPQMLTPQMLAPPRPMVRFGSPIVVESPHQPPPRPIHPIRPTRPPAHEHVEYLGYPKCPK